MTDFKNKILNILFVSSTDNYFIEDTPSFYRIYKNLLLFHEHKNYKVVVLQPKRGKKKENRSLSNGIKCYYFRELSFFKNKLVHFTDFNPFFIVKIIKILKNHKVHLIHVDYPFGITILNFLTKRPISYNAYNVEAIYWKQITKLYLKIPIFLRSLYAKYIYLIEKLAVNFASNINAISNADRENFIKLYKIPSEKIIVSGMGYKEEIFNSPVDQIIARERLKIENTKFVVIFHGHYYNNFANVEAINIIRKKIANDLVDPDILIIIAGNMPNFKNTENLKFFGFVKDLKILLYAADIALVPIFKGSGVRIKIIDYLSALIPIVTTKQGAMGLNIKDGIHGFIVSNKKPVESLIKKLYVLKNNRKKLNEFKNNILNLIRQDYEWKEILKRLEKRYRSLIEIDNNI